MRLLLACVTLLLFVLVLGERVARAVRPDALTASAGLSSAVGASAGANAGRLGTIEAAGHGASRSGARSGARSATPAGGPGLRPAPVAGPGAPAVAGGSTLDRLARLAARQQLHRAAGQTYLDSLMVATDSVVRRWPDRGARPLRVALVLGGVEGWQPMMADIVRDALATWERAGLGVHFALVPDTTDADITVRWIDRFGFDRAGQTDLTWDQLGYVHHASISLALRTNLGVRLPPSALLSVAVHEAGHAIGLPHSADSADVMFPATRTGVLTERDRRTALLLYQLPPGPVRDSAPIPRQ
ncbi:MAG TPA: matrixin family metalloprotease [Gemmatimonadales bacterium]|nr:matrixin family metalloprotease [Gemmatimonadales bacterium]